MTGTPDGGLFAQRLDALLCNSELTLQGIADGINAMANKQVTSPSNLSMMRRGKRSMPRYDKLLHIAEYFGVEPGYFTDTTPHDGGELERARAAIRAQAAQPIADRLDGLPAKWVTVVTEMLDQARTAHGLPPISSPSEDSGH